jgi:hypothetical protein
MAAVAIEISLFGEMWLFQFDGLNHHLMGEIRLKRTSSAARSASATA